MYDPAQGRFLTRDPANVLNRYVGFGTNPVMKVDPTGLSPIVDTITDIAFCIAFAIGIVVTGGAAAVAGGAVIAGIEAGTEIAAAVVQTAIWQQRGHGRAGHRDRRRSPAGWPTTSVI